MPTEPQKRCPECDRKLPGHGIGCVSANEQARKVQDALEGKTAPRLLKEIRECDKRDLCEDHHD